MNNKQSTINLGGAVEPGSSKNNKTGEWRTGMRPQINKDKCKNCLICAHYCPEDAFIIKDGEVLGIDYNYCKGCGICARECPSGAITMIDE